MPYKIRTKLIIAFFAVIIPFIVIGGILVLYTADAIHKSVHKIQTISEERAEITNFILAMDKAIMQANDYIITGESKYSDAFYVASNEVEKRLQRANEVIHAEERKTINDAGIAWQNIKETALKIFAIPEPVGNKDAARLMEEMDYTWAYPAIERLKELRATHIEEFKNAANIADRVWVHSWIIMTGGAFTLTVIGIFFAFFYSSRFTRPIKAIHNGADAIAGGNFKTRLDIKTGDELQQLANAMNEMAAQLDSFYSNLQGIVDERTRAVKESEERFRVFFNSGNDGVFVHTITADGKPGNFIEVNEVACKRLGYTREELLNMSPYDIDAPDMAEKREAMLKDFIANGHALFEMVHVARDGTRIPVEINVRLFNLRGRPMVIAFARDIIERKKAEEALRESETRFRSIVETAKDAMICISEDGIIYQWNNAAMEMFGYSAHEAIGENIHSLIMPAKYREKAYDGIKNFFQTGTGPVIGKTIDVAGLRKDGVEFPVELSISAMIIKNKWHAVGIIRDVTKRKEAEDSLKQHLEELERFQKATIDREFRIKELRDRVKELEEEMKRLKG